MESEDHSALRATIFDVCVIVKDRAADPWILSRMLGRQDSLNTTARAISMTFIHDIRHAWSTPAAKVMLQELGEDLHGCHRHICLEIRTAGAVDWASSQRQQS